MALRVSIFTLVVISGVLYFSQGLLFETSVRRIATTDSTLAINNLESQISSAKDLVAKYPQRADFKRSLFNLLSTKMIYLGSYSDFETLKELAYKMPEDDTGLYYRAKYQSLIHEFEKSKQIIAKVKNKDSTLIKKLRKSNALALSENIDSLRKEQTELIKTSKRFSDLVLMAEIEAELGNFDSADHYYDQAITNYKDSSPFVPAYVFFRRAVMWGEKADKPKQALKYYDEAVHYLPQYVKAQVHRAELLDKEEAELALKKVLDSEDPEPKGVLAELYLNSNQQEAKKLINGAQKDYDNLLAKYNKAFADHGSEFFASVGGDASKSLSLAKSNYENRKTQRALMLLIESSLAAKSKADLCSSVAKAEQLEITNLVLKSLISEHASTCS